LASFRVPEGFVKSPDGQICAVFVFRRQRFQKFNHILGGEFPGLVQGFSLRQIGRNIMRVMTFNLRFENEEDGMNAWIHRRNTVIRLIRKHRPMILGTQEGRWSQLAYLNDHLNDYDLFVPSNRVIDETCQYPSLFFLKRALTVLEGREFWLSRTPDVHRSKDWDSAFPRMMSCAKFRARKSGETVFWAAVTHLDHMGANARYEQARMIADWIQQHRTRVILMGDFNDSPDSSVHRVLTDTGLQDTWKVLGMEEGNESFTHHGFEGIPAGTRMDWIMTSPPFRVKKAQIVRDRFDGRYPSDHFPYVADLHMADPRIDP
jgi:endonuclease/exonuclease/phosphatase family metal-dependent hydrolase